MEYIYTLDEDRLLVLALFEKGFRKEITLELVQKVKTDFLAQYPLPTLRTQPRSSFLDFRKQIVKHLVYANSFFGDKSQAALNQVKQLEKVTLENLQVMTEKADQIDNIHQATEDLYQNGLFISKKAVKVRRRAQCNYYANTIIMFCVGLVRSKDGFVLCPCASVWRLCSGQMSSLKSSPKNTFQQF